MGNVSARYGLSMSKMVSTSRVDPKLLLREKCSGKNVSKSHREQALFQELRQLGLVISTYSAC